MKTQHIKAKQAKKIPPPPGLGASYEELIAYHQKYSLDELERAGHVEEVPVKEQREVQASAAYQLLRDYGLRVKLTRKDCERLSLVAARQGVDVEVLVKGWIKKHLREETPPFRNGKA